MTWINASGRALGIFLYFIVATVWFPNFVLRLDSLVTASQFIRDVVVLVLWGGGLVAGMWLLRIGQRRGLI